MASQVQAVNSLSSANYNSTNNTKIPIKKKPVATEKLKDFAKRPAEKLENQELQPHPQERNNAIDQKKE
jgi:hypothetical protein